MIFSPKTFGIVVFLYFLSFFDDETLQDKIDNVEV